MLLAAQANAFTSAPDVSGLEKPITTVSIPSANHQTNKVELSEVESLVAYMPCSAFTHDISAWDALQRQGLCN